MCWLNETTPAVSWIERLSEICSYILVDTLRESLSAKGVDHIPPTAISWTPASLDSTQISDSINQLGIPEGLPNVGSLIKDTVNKIRDSKCLVVPGLHPIGDNAYRLLLAAWMAASFPDKEVSLLMPASLDRLSFPAVGAIENLKILSPVESTPSSDALVLFPNFYTATMGDKDAFDQLVVKNSLRCTEWPYIGVRWSSILKERQLPHNAFNELLSIGVNLYKLDPDNLKLGMQYLFQEPHKSDSGDVTLYWHADASSRKRLDNSDFLSDLISRCVEHSIKVNLVLPPERSGGFQFPQLNPQFDLATLVDERKIHLVCEPAAYDLCKYSLSHSGVVVGPDSGISNHLIGLHRVMYPDTCDQIVLFGSNSPYSVEDYGVDSSYRLVCQGDANNHDPDEIFSLVSSLNNKAPLHGLRAGATS